MTIPTFATRAKQWSSPPVDDVGYIPAKDLLAMPDGELITIIEAFEHTRYNGWRNFGGRWRRALRLDETTDKDVLDYGCGVGIEALQYARTKNRVSVADISKDNVRLAERVLALADYPAVSGYTIENKIPPILSPKKYDVIHCAGVLHHIPKPEPIVEWMASILREYGELRLMVYTDEAWKIATRTEPPEDDVYNYEEFDAFWQHWDPIGGYADYYTRPRLQERFGEWFTVETYQPLTQHGEYAGAILRKR